MPDKNELMTIGQFLKRERLKRSLTQLEMADKLGVSRTHYNCIEIDYKDKNGNYTHRCGIMMQQRIAKFVKRSTTYISKLIDYTYNK